MNENHPHLPSGFFITGTDTGIGKTYVCRLLFETLIKTVPVTYLKPVQTGCQPDGEGELVAPDFEYILQSGFQRIAEYRTHVPYRFKESCSPHLAARLGRKDISFNYIKDCLIKLTKEEDRAQLAIVEGAGGIYTPLGKSAFMLDLMATLDLPVILVVSPKLGTLNHTLLSINALHERSLRLAGVIMNDAYGLPQDFIYAENREFIRERISPIPFLHLPFYQPFVGSGIADLQETSYGPISNASSGPALEAFCNELLR
jgi:dethiobiotin synthetase